ncbi:MAG TPA: M24 family metallopeptidase, partial [bacterium]|nr:M24 family metallopeptidase [bacterium]
ADLLAVDGRAYLLASNIEAGRVMAEELAGLGVEPLAYPWHEPAARRQRLAEVTDPDRLLSDSGEFGERVNLSELHFPLTASELDRYRGLGAEVALALTRTARAVEPGWTETAAAARMAGELMAGGIFPTVLLVAADERIGLYRHPLPTGRRVGKCLMLVACGRRQGLIVSITRLLHFGPLPAELARRHAAVARVDGALIAATRPGRPLGEVFRAGRTAYERSGFPEEWRLHHQGGPTGYLGRYFRVTEAETRPAAERAAFSWNPSIAGTKSEDTIIIDGEKLPEVVSADPAWPVLEVETGPARPDILIR